MLPSPCGCRLGPREYYFSRPQRVHFCYGPVTRNLPWGDLVDRLRRFCFHLLRYPNYGALTSTPAGLTPAEHASLTWTHNHTVRLPRFTSAASYSGQFVTRYLAVGILWRRLSLNVYGMGFQNHERRKTRPHPMSRPMTVPSVLTSPRHLPPDRILREEHTPPHNLRYIHAPTRIGTDRR